MRNLDKINVMANSTKRMFSISLVIPIFTGWAMWSMAVGAAEKLPLKENGLALTGLIMIFIALVSLPVPYLFKWDWQAKFFGAPFLSCATGAIIGLCPVLCIILYSSLPLWASIAVAIFEGLVNIKWCLRFVNVFRIIYRNKNLFNYVYEEDLTEVYYVQQADFKVVIDILKFKQYPSSIYFLLSTLAAFSLAPFSSAISRYFGIPFFHIFMGIMATPLNLMFFGLGTKAWLACYFYPMKIHKETHKPVYVDMSSQPRTSLKFISRSLEL